MTRRAAPAALAADVACVLAFAALGRSSHEEGATVAGTLEVAAPFLVGLGAAWIAARAWRRPVALATGVQAWAGTLVVGMVLRNLAFDRGTPASFVVVAAIVLAALIVGWRALRVPVAARTRRGAA
jgi:hypothetical protein